MIWSVAHGHSYSSSFNIFAILAGVLLLRGGLKTAKWVQRFLLFFVAGLVVAALGMCFIYPTDYFIVAARHADLSTAIGMLFAIASAVVSIWLAGQLGRPEITEAQRAQGINPPGKAAPVVLGSMLALSLMVVLKFMLSSATAKEAVRRAQLEVGPGYKCFVTNLQFSTNAVSKSAAAIVVAYSSTDLRRIRVAWTEQVH